jgi:hypothetical protein
MLRLSENEKQKTTNNLHGINFNFAAMKSVFGLRFQWLALLLLCCLFGCTTDFPTITPYKETMVIYGLLNPNDPVQYIRISKAFLGEGNALVMAKQPDSIYYGDILDVKLERYDANGNLSNTFPYSRLPLDSVPKDEGGTFVAPNQVVYAGLMLKDTANVGGITYKLTVRNRQSGLTATASTIVIDNFLVPAFSYPTDFTTPPNQTFFNIFPTDQAAIYNMTMQVSYTDTNHVSHFLFTWNLGDQTNVAGNTSPLPFSFTKSYLFSLDSIASQGLPRDPTQKYTFTIELNVSGGTNDLYTYIQATQPANSIVQDRPQFTNITNGVGLFTCRNSRSRRIGVSVNTITKLDSYFQ